MSNSEFSGFVLTGGKSSRMGEDKAFLKINGKTFLKRAIKTLSTVCEDRVKIVLNQNQTDLIENLPSNIPYVFDIVENRGAIGGIYTALKNCETKFAIILAVDLPLVTSEVIEKLVEITLSNNKFIAVVPRQNDEKLQPLSGIYLARYAVRPLEKLITENETASVNDFLELVSPRTVRQNKLTSNTEDIFLNINHPADYTELERIIAETHA